MLKEIIHFLIEEKYPTALKNGYTYESIALLERYHRNKEHWQNHINNCHQFVIEKCHSDYKSIAILGSGHLIEIPLKYLLDLNYKIYLIDLVHPKSVHKLQQKHPNQIFLHKTDISKFFEKKEIEIPITDILLSANMISQVAFLPGHKMLQQGKTEEQVWTDCHKILLNHLNWLRLQTKDKKVYFFCDDQKIVFDKKANKIIDQFSTIYDVKIPYTKDWMWEIAPSPEFQKNLDIKLHMISGEF